VRAAVVELNSYHDEVLPTIVYALNQLGVEPDVYTTREAARRNAFAMTAGLRFRLMPADGESRFDRAWTWVRGTPARNRRYDVLIMNSVEPVTALETAARIDLPTIAIVHNADLLRGDEAYRRFFAGGTRLPMFLGRHIAATLGGQDERAWLAPVYLGDAATTESEGEITRLCVQGNLEYTRRDYPGLVDAVVKLAAERQDFVIRIVGRSDTRDGNHFRATINERGVADRFTFSTGEISHGSYLALVAASDFILPLLDSRMPKLAPYFGVKITSSMSMAVALGVLPVVETSLAALYGVDGAALTYESGDLAWGIRSALEMRPSVRKRFRRRLAEVRVEALTASVGNLSASLDRLGLKRG
jgi:hypothetical protein